VPGSRIATWVADQVDRHRFVILAVLTAGFFYSVAIRALAKPFWHDEIYTILLTGLPSLSTMWAAMRDGLDLSPPLNAVLTRGVRAVVGVDPIGIRAVPIISFWIMTILLFAMVRRRANGLVALTAGLFPLFTAGYRHSYDARSYGLMMMLFALALFAWTEAASGRKRRLNLAVLAVALAAGVWNHYYAVLAYLPVAVGEFTRTLRTRRLDSGIVAAIILSILLASPMVALLGVPSHQSPTFWSPASTRHFSEAYYFLVEPMLDARFLIATVLIIALAAVGYASRTDQKGEKPALPAHEIAAVLAALLFPVAGVLLGLVVTGVFVPRYILPGVVGLSIAVAYGLWYLSHEAKLVSLVLPAVFVLSLAELLLPVTRLPHPVDSRPALVASLKTPGPTAVSGGLTYLQLWFYAPPQIKSRLMYIADPELARRYTGSDTIDLGFQALARWTPVNVASWNAFTERNSEFRVYAFGSGWLVEQLRDSGASFEEVDVDASATLYKVRMKPRY
jgi:hypothetical protein